MAQDGSIQDNLCQVFVDQCRRIRHLLIRQVYLKIQVCVEISGSRTACPEPQSSR